MSRAAEQTRILRRAAGHLGGRVVDLVLWPVDRRIRHVIDKARLGTPLVFGDPRRLTIARDAVLVDAMLNLQSGTITVGPSVFFGHGVMLLTGTHDPVMLGPDRQRAVPSTGRDIVLEEGVWVASRVTVIGPARIGAHAVLAAGAVVTGDVAPCAIVAGVPARVVGTVPAPGDPTAAAHRAAVQARAAFERRSMPGELVRRGRSGLEARLLRRRMTPTPVEVGESANDPIPLADVVAPPDEAD